METHSLIFGNRTNAINPQEIQGKPFITQGFNQVIFQHQIHDNTGLIVTPQSIPELSNCLTHDSDYLLTNVPGLGIGVLTADCMPIALYDPKNKAIGIIHAGWQGTVKEIVINAVQHMQRTYATQPRDLFVYFGPSAQPCCYCVQKDFISNIPHHQFLPHIIQRRAQKIYVDLPAYNRLLLKSIGILPQNIISKEAICTICNHGYVSYRRDQGTKLRQTSIIALQ